MEEAFGSWEEFFDSHAPHYMENPFTRNTRVEVDFLLDLFPLPAGSRVLDMGCGTGRHSVELASRGFVVTGIDISAGMLDQARRAANQKGVEVEFIRSDATEYRGDGSFDMAVCLCEGGFGLIGMEEDPIAHDRLILEGIHSALKPGAPFVLTALNGYHIIRRATEEMVTHGAFDPASMVTMYMDEWNLPEGKRKVMIRERLFIPPELVSLLHFVGFETLHVFGGTAGDWGQRPLKLDEIEAMYVCRKR